MRLITKMDKLLKLLEWVVAIIIIVMCLFGGWYGYSSLFDEKERSVWGVSAGVKI